MSRYDTARVNIADLSVATVLHEFIESSVLPGVGVAPALFWGALSDAVAEFTPLNRQLLDRRDQLQASIDEWHRQHRSLNVDRNLYEQFLREIGYLLPSVADVVANAEDVDEEICLLAGPQLVVPLSNARYALNAANARWGSLYDALYGSDVIEEAVADERQGSYSKARGARVIAWAKRFLDEVIPLDGASHADVNGYSIRNGNLIAKLANGQFAGLRDPAVLAGYNGLLDSPSAILLRHHNLHLELQIDRSHHVGAGDSAGIKDILLESALTVIQDCEDSVAAVDATDKCAVYRNWLGLMKGDLAEEFEKSGCLVRRTLNEDRVYKTVQGETLKLHGRSLMLVRNVGLLMTTDAVLDRDGSEIPEGILDAFVTVLIALHDRRGPNASHNSRQGSIYIVKPKLHGPDEVAFTCRLFERVETAFDLKPNTIKLGIMDEERRTTLNLKACIAVARSRVIFINTGFLDRTGDEIHTDMEAGPVCRKEAMRQTRWLNAYEQHNVATGLVCGLSGKAQIGKGMWTMPDRMAAMFAQKIAHPKSGATTAWVPSPTAAVIHAVHYHLVDVFACQRELATKDTDSYLGDMLSLPLVDPTELTAEDIQRELENNIQGILGYVVRWVDDGIGCSKIPDINGIGLMEDRATLRISSQHVTNWLLHGVCSSGQVNATLKRMAEAVDAQNANTAGYRAMSPDFDSSIAFQATCSLVFDGRNLPNGYTEPVLHRARLLAKQRH